MEPNISHTFTLLLLTSQPGLFGHVKGESYNPLEGVSFPGDIQNPPGCVPVPPALGVPAQAGGLDKMISRGPFQPLPFCDSMILSLLAAGRAWLASSVHGSFSGEETANSAELKQTFFSDADLHKSTLKYSICFREICRL